MNLRLNKALYGGACISTDPGDPAVPFTLPGEVAEPGPEGELVSILEASPDRVTPRCPHFGACGGCHYQHADYPAQLALKQQILTDILDVAGLRDLPPIQTHSTEPWGYRNRIRLRIGLMDSELRAGYNRRGSHQMLPIRECPISAALLLRAAEAVLALAGSPAWNAWGRELGELELFTTPGESQLQLTFFLRSERKTDVAAFCTRLKLLVPELAGAGVVVVGASGQKAQSGAQWGAAGLQYPVAGRKYWVSRGSFFQINRFLADTLVSLVTAGRSGTLAWDLYAGVGLFARPLAETFAHVTGVETIVADLGAVLKPPAHRAVGSTVVDFLRHAVVERDRPELIVMDPPRAGLGTEVTTLLGRIQAPELVYVSCDPTTLARDLKAVVDSGYTIRDLHLVDLFPQTFHLETVVILHR